MSMITASAWVPRGYAASFPTRYDVDDKELARISKLAKLKLDDAQEDLDEEKEEADANGAENGEPKVKVNDAMKDDSDDDDDLKEYDLDNYDEDEDGEENGIFATTKSLAFHESNAEDPYITLKDNEDEDSDREELQVLATDNMLVAAKVEDEVAHLEVYVYEDEADNLYVHHDIMLPAIPLCAEWLDVAVGKTQSGDPVDQGKKSNYVAVGTFEPDIEIWDLDTIDCMYPNAILGQGGEEESADVTSAKKKKRKKTKKPNDSYHVDAVLALAANRSHRTLLASASADKTVKLWDLSASDTTKCASSYSHHTDKVCSLAWHPTQTTVLLSGSYDRTAVAADMRAPNASPARWGVDSDIEHVRWNPHDSNFFYITTEGGSVYYFDVRNAPKTPEQSKSVWRLQAHDDSVTAFDVNPKIPGFFVTGAADKQVKLWNVQEGPSMVVSRNLEIGKVFTTMFAPDDEVAFRLAVAGSKGAMQIWDTSTNPAVRHAFATRVALPMAEEGKERLVGVQSDDSESEDEGIPEPEGTHPDGWESMDEE
jgi:periodic tryptophan protein 1